MNQQMAIRVDASTQIGTGHFMRCLVLADTVKQRGVQVCFISRHMPQYLRDMLLSKGHQFLLLHSSPSIVISGGLSHALWLGTSQQADARDTIQALSDQDWDWLVVDHYALDARWESALRQCAKRILVIDDIADRQHSCDMLLDQNYHIDMAARYAGRVPSYCQLLLGPCYALLRAEFRQLRKMAKPRSLPIKRILVCFGGVDANNYTTHAIEALASVDIPDLHVDVVVGTEHPEREQVESACVGYGFTCYVQTDKMAELMVRADLAVGASGSVTWERCCLSLPAIVFAVARNQERASSALASQGAVWLGSSERVISEIERALNYLLMPNRLHEMSIKAAELVDGLGAVRLSDALCLGDRHP